MKTGLKKTMSLFLPVLVAGCGGREVPVISTVASVDLTRYSGRWYEIARYENRFEKGCVGASADYELEEGYIKVINRCYDRQGVMIDQAEGKAYPVDGSGNAKLKVTFFWPFYGDYWILMLAEDYRYSVVGDPKRKYLWILARTPELNGRDKEIVLQRLQELQYSPEKLYWTTGPGSDHTLQPDTAVKDANNG